MARGSLSRFGKPGSNTSKFLVIAVAILLCLGVLCAGTIQSRKLLISLTKSLEAPSNSAEASQEPTVTGYGDYTGRNDEALTEATGPETPAGVVVLKVGVNVGRETTFVVSAGVGDGVLASSPVSVYIDVSDVISGSGPSLADLADQAKTRVADARGVVSASPDGMHLLWKIISVNDQNAVLTFKVPFGDLGNSTSKAVSVVAKTMTNLEGAVSSNCEVSDLESGSVPDGAECKATVSVGDQDGPNAGVFGGIVAVLSFSEVSGNSATVSVDFRNTDGKAKIGEGGIITVDMDEVFGQDVILDEGSLPLSSNVGENSLVLPLPRLGAVGSGEEAGSVSFKINVVDGAFGVVVRPVLANVIFPGLGAAVPCKKLAAESVCSAAVAINAGEDAPLKIEVKVDGRKIIKAFQGATVEYIIAVKNTGSDVMSTPVTVDIGNVLENSSMEVPPSGKGITRFSDQKTLTWNPPGGFQPGRTVKIKYVMRVNPDAEADKTLVNRVVKTPNSQCAEDNPSNAGCAATVVVLADDEEQRAEPVPGATGLAVKTLVNGYSKAAEVQPGQQLRYSVELTNTRDIDINTVNLEGDLSQVVSDAHLIDGSLRGFVKGATGDALTWDGMTIPAGETLILGFHVMVKTTEEDDDLWEKQIISRIVTTLLSEISNKIVTTLLSEIPKENSSNCADPNTTDPNCIAIATVMADPESTSEEDEDRSEEDKSRKLDVEANDRMVNDATRKRKKY